MRLHTGVIFDAHRRPVAAVLSPDLGPGQGLITDGGPRGWRVVGQQGDADHAREHRRLQMAEAQRRLRARRRDAA